MPEVIELTLYTFDELSDEAKVKARDWYRDGALDYHWWQFVYADFEDICDLMGVSLRTATVPLMGGGTRQKPKIYFRGFWSQGDGACFEARYSYRKRCRTAVRAYAPLDTELHRIVDTLAKVQRRNFYQLQAACFHRGHYHHEYCMHLDVNRRDVEVGGYAEDTVKEALRDLAHWLYCRLEKEYEHLTSDEAMDAAIEANRYRFTEQGQFYD